MIHLALNIVAAWIILIAIGQALAVLEVVGPIIWKVSLAVMATGWKALRFAFAHVQQIIILILLCLAIRQLYQIYFH